jgi:hypothetical protein
MIDLGFIEDFHFGLTTEKENTPACSSRPALGIHPNDAGTCYAGRFSSGFLDLGCRILADKLATVVA